MPLSKTQLDQLFKPINKSRIKKNPKGFSHLEEWDVEAHLTRIFGFEGWDKKVLVCEPIYEDYVTWKPRDGGEKSGWDVAYRATVRLIIKDPEGCTVKTCDDVATGSASHQPSRGDANDLAIKDAVSSAVKRAAKALGNQFGLSLYDDGSLASVVGSSLAYAEPAPEAPQVPPEVVREQVAAIRDRMLGEAPETTQQTF